MSYYTRLIILIWTETQYLVLYLLPASAVAKIEHQRKIPNTDVIL